MPILGLLIFAGIIFILALYPRSYCVKCGKNRAGRMAAETVDRPICIECVRKG